MTHAADRDEQGVLHLGSPETSTCRHCGTAGIPVPSSDGRTCWWRVPLDCCDGARARQARAREATRTVRQAQATRAAGQAQTRQPAKEGP